MKHENRFLKEHSFDLLNVFIAIIMIVLFATHLPSLYEGWEIRRRVANALGQALEAQKIVDQNLIQNLRLDNGWIYPCLRCNVPISIDGETGIITIKFPGDIEGGGKTLVLFPIYGFEGGRFLLAGDIRRGELSNNQAIVWLCTSAQTQFNDPILQNKKGTLRSNYAPEECRYLPRQYVQVEN